jgi:hypothetical protein
MNNMVIATASEAKPEATSLRDVFVFGDCPVAKEGTLRRSSYASGGCDNSRVMGQHATP